MKPNHLLSPLQRAWLDELGADIHWLVVGTPAIEPPAAPDAAAAGQPAEQGAAAVAPRAAQNPAAGPAASVEPVTATRPRPPAAPAASQAAAAPQASGPVVPGGGVSSQPLYFIVGEQPGIEDDAAGKPFQGDSGRLLQAMLAAARLPEPESAYLTYVVKHRAVGGRVPGAEEIAAGLAGLRQEIARVQPHWILALGKTAAHAILGSADDLDALRGGPHAWTGPDGNTIPVWVTHHPSSLLVRSAGKPEAWRDLVALAQAVRAAQG